MAKLTNEMIDQRMMEHARLYGSNPTPNDSVILSRAEWQRLAIRRENRYGMGYQAGYSAARRHAEIERRKAAR